MKTFLWMKKRRMILLLDLMSTTIAWGIGIWFRFRWVLLPWQKNMYTMILFMLYLIWIVLYGVKRTRVSLFSLKSLDPAENVVNVFRGRLLLYVTGIFLLTMAGYFSMISRLMMFVIGFADVIIDLVLRFVLRAYQLRSVDHEKKNYHYLILTRKGLEAQARARLQDVLPADADVFGVALMHELGTVLPEGNGTLYNRVFLYFPGARREELSHYVALCRENHLTAQLCLYALGEDIPRNMIRSGHDYAVAEYLTMDDRQPVLGVNFVVSQVEAAAYYVTHSLKTLAGRYICFCNVHTTVMSGDDSEYAKIQNRAALTFADGEPIARIQRSKGFAGARRVAGPDFMDAVFSSPLDGSVSHFFYGSKPEPRELLQKNLMQRYPGIKIAGMISPPFRDLTPEEEERDIRQIRESGAGMVWIGLGAPKQEKWMAAHTNQFPGGRPGGGAGFDFYAGTIKRAPKWVSRIGLEWFYRLCQDPGRLLNRYVVTNTKFAWRILTGHFTKKEG